MEALLLIGISQALFTALYFVVKNDRRKCSKYVVFLMSSLAVYMFIRLLPAIFDSFAPRGFFQVNAVPLLFGPFLFFYVLFEIDEKRIFKKKYLFHLLPFLVFFLIFTFFSPPGPGGKGPAGKRGRPPVNIESPSGMTSDNPGLPGRAGEMQAGKYFRDGKAGHNPPPDAGIKELSAFILDIPGLIIISFLFYGVSIFFLLRRHRENIKNFFSYETELLNLKWVNLIVVSFVVSTAFMVAAFYVSPALKKHNILNPQLAESYGLTFFIFIFSIFSIKQPAIYGSDSNIEGEETGGSEKKYEKSGLREEEEKDYIDRLNKIMEEEKLFLDGDLTISGLSDATGIPRHHISQVINSRMSMNFYSYVNSFRVSYAASMLDDELYSDYSVLRIAFDAGFNTKSAFNRIFKDFTGKTPTEYRKSVLAASA